MSAIRDDASTMNIESRPTDMLQRQLQANRNAARYRNPETGKRHHAHIPQFRPYFVREIIAMRAELRKRRVEGPLTSKEKS